MHVGSICARSLATCRRDTSVVTLARQMRDAHLGEVVVVEERGGRICPIGIITDHDIVVRVAAAGRDPHDVTAGDLAIDRCETIQDAELVYDAIWYMRDKRLHHLPVIDSDGALIGMLRAADVSEFLASELVEVTRIAPHHAEAAGCASVPHACLQHGAMAIGGLPT